ncbi:PIG-L family deacetylase [Balneolaceae bacterium ANBcel3]|nr:PIG-L family deacetylase [Balneolaceae bacterium ANBcel3]
MKVLYIFPHPDDESFGPAPAMHAQLQGGHEVCLLTYTRGGATKVRHELGKTVDEMGEIRLKEMKEVSRVLGLSHMTVLNLPDSGLKNMDPLELEKITESFIINLRPDVLVTYPVHGISGFHDHLVTHAIVKRVFCKMKKSGDWYPRRLAFFTLAESDQPDGKFRLSTSTKEEIDCAVPLSRQDLLAGEKALACYKTYKKVIEDAKVMSRIGETVYYEFFDEAYDPAVSSLFHGL